MPRTPGAELPPPSAKRRRSRHGRERAIEDLLYAYPDLIEPGFSRLRRQQVLDPESRLDLLFEGEEETVIVEIKHGSCGVEAVRQLERYLGLEEVRGKPVRGILVGAALTPVARRACVRSRFPITFKRTDTDVPTRVVVCQACRRARPAQQGRCPGDGSREVLVP